MRVCEHLEVRMAKLQALEGCILVIILVYVIVSSRPVLGAAAILVKGPGKVEFWPAPCLQENPATTPQSNNKPLRAYFYLPTKVKTNPGVG